MPVKFRLFFFAALLAAVLGLAAVACTTPVVPEAGPPASTTAPTTTAPPTTTTLPEGETPPPTTTILSPTTTIPALEVPGITDTTIRVGVIADVETGGIADGRSRSAWGGVAAWAEAVNLFGGLGGRQIEVVYIDTGLFNHEAAIARACQGDIFAIVGSDALFDHEGLSQLGGEDCPVLDFPAVAHSPQRQGRAETFLSNPTPPAVVQVGPLQTLAETNPEGVDAAAMILLEDLSTSIIRGEKEIEAALSQGYTTVLEPTTQLNSLLCAPQEMYDQMTEQGVRSLLWPTDGVWLAQFLAGGDPENTTDADATDGESDDSGDGEADEENGQSEDETGTTASESETPESDTASDETASDEPPEDTAEDVPEDGETSASPENQEGSQEDDAQEPTATSPDSTPISPFNCPVTDESDTSEDDAGDPRERLSLEFALCDITCNRSDFSAAIAETPTDASNIRLATHLLPLEEAQLNRDLTQYIITLSFLSQSDSRLPSEPDLQGVAAWAAARLFEEAVRRATQPEADAPLAHLTTEAVLEAVSTIEEWDAHGLHAPSNPGQKIPTDCFVLLAYRPSQETAAGTPANTWQRQHPATPGQWDCSPDNLYTLRITGGLQAEGG